MCRMSQSWVVSKHVFHDLDCRESLSLMHKDTSLLVLLACHLIASFEAPSPLHQAPPGSGTVASMSQFLVNFLFSPEDVTCPSCAAPELLFASFRSKGSRDWKLHDHGPHRGMHPGFIWKQLKLWFCFACLDFCCDWGLFIWIIKNLFRDRNSAMRAVFQVFAVCKNSNLPHTQHRPSMLHLSHNDLAMDKASNVGNQPNGSPSRGFCVFLQSGGRTKPCTALCGKDRILTPSKNQEGVHHHELCGATQIAERVRHSVDLTWGWHQWTCSKLPSHQT